MRATDLPDKWQLLLTALNHNDENLAHEICMKYEFGMETIKRDYREYTLKWTSPSGNTGIAGSYGAVGRLMGTSGSSVSKKFIADKSDKVVWTAGKNRGWRLEREVVEKPIVVGKICGDCGRDRPYSEYERWSSGEYKKMCNECREKAAVFRKMRRAEGTV